VMALAVATADGGTAELAQALGELGHVVVLAGGGSAPDGVSLVRADLTSPDGAAAAWASAERVHGPGEALVTLPAPPSGAAPFTDTTDDQWAALLRDHLLVAAHTARAAAPEMIRRGRGAIAMVTWRPEAASGHVALATVSGAVRHFARTLASEIGEDGVTVNAIAVGVGRPADAAPAIRLLCSPDGGYLTSEALTLAGTDT
jgi:NAD(P)-dependent dehydrogenase (short-subunit alcohol dehydrogenase family)